MGRDEVEPIVRCPVRRDWISFNACRNCTAKAHLATPANTADWFVVCGPEGELESATGALRDLSLLAYATPVHEVMGTAVHCVSAQATLVAITRIFAEANPGIVVVVDEEHHPIGVIDERDLLEPPRKRLLRAIDVMSPIVTSLLEETPVAQAMSLIVEHGMQHVPVVSAGRVVGVISAADLLRWVEAHIALAE